jgi:hypothetical protein
MNLWEFKSYGGQCRDGACHGSKQLADSINNTSYVWHTKNGGDGYGHIIHNACACAKPLIVKKEYYKGKLAEILPAFNEQTQSFVCKIHFSDTLDFKIVNTQLQVNIITGTTKDALLIPRNYLQYGNLVTVKGEKEPIKIETKFISTEWVQVLSGLDENNTIITDKIK